MRQWIMAAPHPPDAPLTSRGKAMLCAWLALGASRSRGTCDVFEGVLGFPSQVYTNKKLA